MRKYIAFLRGINISGKNKIDMAALKASFESAGFTQVSTYLNSGNVAFCTDESSSTSEESNLEEQSDQSNLEEQSDQSNLKDKIEVLILEQFGFEIPVYVVDAKELNDVFTNAPSWWDSGDKSKYDNLIFILSEDSPETICEIVGEPSEEIEQIQIYKNVIFWTFDRAKYQKCNWWKRTAAAGIADKLTIRTAGTVRKVCK